jgi:hypothetical protein
MQRIITAHEATINTATVEIKTLAISGKQVTLSVFRQLPEGLVWETEREDDVGFFHREDVTIWGIVRYYWGEQYSPPKDYETFHVLFQEGDRLYRCFVSGDGPDYFPASSHLKARMRWGFDYETSPNERSAWRRYVGSFSRTDQLFIAV